MDLFSELDPRLATSLRAEFDARAGTAVEPLPATATVVLAGHRAAGKSRLLVAVAKLLGKQGLDLDVELARTSGRSLREWVTSDEPGFRVAERALFRELPRGLVVAVGGGFLSKSFDTLRGTLVVEVPISWETYVERLSQDTSRPRLHPELPLAEELRDVYFERAQRHRLAHPMSFVDFMLRAVRGPRPRRVVTLPPNTDAWAFAWQARHAGADLLEVRTDLIEPQDLRAVRRALPLLVAERGRRIPDEWLSLAEFIDRPQPAGATLVSQHCDEPLSPAAACERWVGVDRGLLVKHVEPLGTDPERLLETQAGLLERFGAGRVTVLATGPTALPFRAVLSQKNALDYLALDAHFSAATGQRLVRDAAREWKKRPVKTHDGARDRLGILGSNVAHSRSPRVHVQPFDRIELPESADVQLELERLRPHYRGFAVTNPFKKAAARALGLEGAVNTLVRRGAFFEGYNTDVAGARRALEVLLALPSMVHPRSPSIPLAGLTEGASETGRIRSGRAKSRPSTKPLDSARGERRVSVPPGTNGLAGHLSSRNGETRSAEPDQLRSAEPVDQLRPPRAARGSGAEPDSVNQRHSIVVFGDGGATVALREAALSLNLELTVVRRTDSLTSDAHVAVWTWPPDITPGKLDLRGWRVGVIAYGLPSQQVSAHIRQLGGTPVHLGHRWFIAQARAQRTLWESASCIRLG